MRPNGFRVGSKKDPDLVLWARFWEFSWFPKSDGVLDQEMSSVGSSRRIAWSLTTAHKLSIIIIIDAVLDLEKAKALRENRSYLN
jgi:hypothetical protein